MPGIPSHATPGRRPFRRVSLTRDRAYPETVSPHPWVSRAVRAAAQSPVTETVAHAQEVLYAGVFPRVIRSPLHSGALGHSLHPVLTDVTIGCWVSGSLLDLVGGQGARRSATLLVGAGCLASVPTALAGAADWYALTGDERRIGAAHSLGTDVATFLFICSLVARVRGRHGRGVRLAMVGHVVMAGAGFFGAHLALTRGVARRIPDREEPPEWW